MSDDLEVQFNQLLQSVIRSAYQRGYSDAMAGKAPEHPPSRIAPVGHRRGRPLKLASSSGSAKRARRVIAKRGRLPKGQAETWIKDTITGEWQKPKDIAAAIKAKHGRSINSATMSLTLRKLVKEKAVSRNPKAPQYRRAA
jgi:hypothetical protein